MVHSVSTARGGAKKSAQKYQNSFTYKHNNKSKTTQKIYKLPNDGVCTHCFEQLEWRKKFRKYKPLTQPKKCVECQEKTVTHAYHVLCQSCAGSKNCCAKCMETNKPMVENVKTQAERLAEATEMRLLMMSMTERQRRSYYRKQKRRDNGEEEGGSGTSDESDDDGDSDSEEGDADGEGTRKKEEGDELPASVAAAAEGEVEEHRNEGEGEVEEHRNAGEGGDGGESDAESESEKP